MIKIGLYSEDRTLHTLLSSALGKEFEVLLQPDEDGMNLLRAAGDCDVMILDLQSNHDSLQDRIGCTQRLIATHVPAVIMADDGLRSTAFELVRTGAFGYCRRPPSIRDLKTMLSRAYENSSLRHQLETVQQQLDVPVNCDRLIGSSPQMQRVYQLIHRVTNLNASVLITGESGTGKELIARAIHNLGTRANRPFVAVSCGAIPETLIEAELFGHEKGAYTGTVGSREGYFEQAADGTLFLDEIGELSPALQVKLLRFLQERVIERVGGRQEIQVDARVIAATNADLKKRMADGTFREDLYYRLAVVQVHLPPLRERGDDVMLLAQALLQRYAAETGKSGITFGAEAVKAIRAYGWPGNVRELQNRVKRAVIMSGNRRVTAQDLELEAVETSRQPVSLKEARESLEREMVKAALRKHGGKITGAAAELGVSRPTFYELMEKLGISKPE